MTQVFISYSRKDASFVERFAADLESSGLGVWWDLTDIQGSDVWERKIEEGLSSSDYFIIVMTPDSLDSKWVRREYLSADSKGLKIIPLHLRLCKEVPLALRDVQPIDAISQPYQDVLRETLNVITGQSKTGRPPSRTILSGTAALPVSMGGIEFVKIPRGPFMMGSKSNNSYSSGNEHFMHTVDIPYDYWIGRYPVVGHRFVEYVNDRKLLHPFTDHLRERSLYPAGYISWFDARNFCKWLNESYRSFLPKSYVYRLSTEAEWEKAARGTDGREWPWGNDFDPRLCNSKEGGVDQMTPVDKYSPEGDSPFGVADMVGNAWEWTNTLYRNYPYHANDGRENPNDNGPRTLRGGGYNFSGYRHVRAAARGNDSPDKFYSNYGFRVAVAPAVK